MTLSEVLARAVRLDDALATGDLGFARRCLHDLVTDLTLAVKRAPVACSACGLQFDWPGQLDDHVRLVHSEVLEARDVA